MGNLRYNCDVILAQNTSFSCNDNNSDVPKQYRYGNGARIQFVGSIDCDGDPYTTQSMTCQDHSDDNWWFSGTHWRENTLHQNDADSNALYYLYDVDGNKVNRTPVPYNSPTNYFAYKGKVQAVCKEGYTSNRAECVPIESVAACKITNSEAPGIDCSTDGGKQCLQTGNGVYLYCYSKSQYANQIIHDFNNSCLPAAKIVTIEKKTWHLLYLYT